MPAPALSPPAPAVLAPVRLRRDAASSSGPIPLCGRSPASGQFASPRHSGGRRAGWAVELQRLLLRVVVCALGWMVGVGLALGATVLAQEDQLKSAVGTHWRLLPPRSVAAVNVRHAAGVLAHPYLQRLLPLVQSFDSTPKAEREARLKPLRDAGAFLEKSLKTDWRTALRQLLAGGLTLAVVPGPDQNSPGVLLLAEADSPETLGQLLSAIEAQLALVPFVRAEQRRHGDRVCYRVGEGWYTQRGAMLIAANRWELLRDCLDRVPSAQSEPVAGLAPLSDLPLPEREPLTQLEPAGAARGDQPTVQCVVDLAWLREQPGVKRALRLPAADAGVQFLLGGYLDLLRRGTRTDLTAELAPDGLELAWRVAVEAGDSPAEWAGFFGGGDQPLAAPLAARGSLLSGSWYRDHRPVWRHRERVLQATEIVRIEADDRRVKATGAPLGFQDLLELMGPRLRAVVVHNAGGDDGLGGWPQVALAFETRDLGLFRTQVLEPLRQWAGSAASPAGARFEQRAVDAADLWSWHPGSGGPAWQQAYVPSLVVAGEQMLLASHDRLAAELRAQLEPRAPPERLRPVAGFTQISLPGLARALQAWRDPLAEQASQAGQLTPDQARERLDQAATLLRELGTLELRTARHPDRFEFRTRVIGLAP